ncbi:MAG: hypothetical protein JSV63_03475 [Candidatus Aenigmatarchaeota archaeon]|nr:MAG: hypothetical protein JSV63_03475 [Candidatus Aenigmarchaeota archaeon]
MAFDLSLVVIVGVLTVIFTILVKLFGFPDQVRKNYINKSTKGVSTTLMIILWTSYLLWTIYGFLRNDIVLIIGHGLGVATTGMILLQIIHYRKNK